ncbi:Glycosyl hydrolase catalytic core [Candidatus Electrothrix aarhusensis]
MIKKIAFALLFSLGINSLVLAENTTISHSPFGFTPAAVIPPFQYGLNNPYTFAADLGVTWDRSTIFVWTRIQPDLTTEQYHWMHERQLLDVPKQLRLIANIMIGSPRHDSQYSRYDQYALTNRSFLPRDKNAYKKFVRALVERYDGDGISDMPGLHAPIKYWQVDNEPPHGLNDYAAFLQMTYKAIKQADPEAKVLIGGVPGFPPVSRYIDNFKRSYLPILDDLSKFEGSCFDVFDFHWYGNATGDYLGMKEAYTYIQDTLKKRKLMPLDGFWITEMGTYSGDPVPKRILSPVDFPFQTEKQQAADLVKRNVYALSLGIKKIFMAFGMTEGFKHTGGYFDFTGLIYDGRYDYDQGKGVKKLAYYTYKKMTETLEGSDWESIKTVQQKDDIHIYRLNKNGKAIWIAWNDSSVSKPISLLLDNNIERVIITESIPDYASGKDVALSHTIFQNIKGKISKTSPPQLTFKLNASPVFIEEL